MLGNLVDLWVIREMAKNGVSNCQLSELSGKGNVLAMVQMLPTKEHYLPLQEGISDLLDHPGRERTGQIDATNFGTDENGERPYLDRVRQSSSSGLGPGI